MTSMKWSATFEADGSLLTIAATGDLGADGFCGNVDKLLSHEAWRPGIPTLCDLRGLNIWKLTSRDIAHLVEVHRKYAKMIQENPGPIAVVVAKALDFGMARMWELLANDMYPVFKVFLRMEEALEWLQAGGRESSEEA